MGLISCKCGGRGYSGVQTVGKDEARGIPCKCLKLMSLPINWIILDRR
jgi:hypothetical protein